MPALPPGQPVAPGVTQTPSSFPQWGVNGSNQVIQASSNADKVADMAEGYLVWFSTSQDAQNFAQSGASSNTGSSNPACLIMFPGVLGIGKFCIISKTEVRAMIGGGMLIAAGILGVAALIMVGVKVAGGPGKVAGKVASAAGTAASAAGAPEVGAPVAAAGKMEVDRAQQRHDERVAREVTSRKRDSAKGPALRETSRERAYNLANPQVSDSQRLEPVPF